MPELPEVETIKNDLIHTVVGETITDFSSNSPRQIIPSPAVIKKSVVGAKIVAVERRAKLLLLKVKPYSRSNLYLGIHLKMTGRLLIRKKGDPQDSYTRAIFTLQKNTNVRHSGERQRLQNHFQCKRFWTSPSTVSSGLPNCQNDEEKILELRFCDVRKFGYIRLFKNFKELKREVEDKLGPEPFSKKFTVSYLEKVLVKKNVAIKTALLDQTIISGIGNIYANEALFLAGIRPDKKAKILEYKDIMILRDSIRKVLKKGIKYRGSSAKDESYRDLYGELGHYQNHFLVYERKGKACHKCQSVIEYQKVNGRGTFFCPKCQK